MADRVKMTLEDLKLIKAAMIPNIWAADVLKIDPGRLAEYARTGQLGWNILVSGDTVKHARLSLLKWLGVDVDE